MAMVQPKVRRDSHQFRKKARRKLLRSGPPAERCYWCDKVMADYPPGTNPQPDDCRTVDHVIPLCYHGTNDFDNLVWACYECNNDRSAMPIDDLIRMNEAKLNLRRTA